MRKILLSFLFLLTFCRLSLASVSVDQFITADDVTITHLETMRSTFQGALNSADGGLIQTGTITATKLDTNANPENRWNEAFNDFVYTGLVPPTSASLTSTTTAGTGYIYGARVVKEATAHTYTASKWTFVDLSNNGSYTYSEVAIGTTEPSVSANSIRLARVSTDTTTVSAVRDDRVTQINLSNLNKIQDTDANTKVQVEKSSNEDIIRFDTAGTERLIIDSNGVGFKGSSSGTTTVKASAAAGTTTLTLPIATGTVWASGIENINTTQPSFLVTNTSTQSNIATGSNVTIVLDSEIYDQGNDFASNTFTAPITGKYLLNMYLHITNIDTAASYYLLQIVTSNWTYFNKIDPRQFVADIAGEFLLATNIIADMDINDTAYTTLQQDVGTAQSDLSSNGYVFFSGSLLN